MNMNDIKTIAAKFDIKAGRMKKVELVRAIQAAEGNLQCFGTERILDCPETNCCWREDCASEYAKL